MFHSTDRAMTRIEERVTRAAISVVERFESKNLFLLINDTLIDPSP